MRRIISFYFMKRHDKNGITNLKIGIYFPGNKTGDKIVETT